MLHVIDTMIKGMTWKVKGVEEGTGRSEDL